MPLVRTTDRARDARARGEAAFLGAAEELVAGGARYADLPITEIAARAGFSRASFYAYFSDKRALAMAVGRRFRDDLESDLGRWVADSAEGGGLPAVLGEALAVFERHRGAVLLLAEAAAYDPDVGAFRRDFHERFERRVTGLIAVTAPAVSAQEAAIRAFTLVRATQSVVVEYLAADRFEREQVVGSLALIWQATLNAPPAETS